MKGERRELTPQMKKRRRKKNIIGFTFILPRPFQVLCKR